MRARADFFLEGLLSLDRYERADRRAVFRQSVASIALAAPGQAPLEGCDEAALVRSMRVALADGLFEDLGWLAAPAAGVALYEIAGALPLGVERRDLGRIVLEELYEGDAATFVSIATRMALGGAARALSGAGIRARVALALGLPAATEVRGRSAGPGARLPAGAVHLVARDARHRIAAGAAPGGAPAGARRAGGRRPARAAATRSRRSSSTRSSGDAPPSDGERQGAPRPTPSRAPGARCSTIARRWCGATSRAPAGSSPARSPPWAKRSRTALSSRLSPTEWRRAATSLVACIAVDPERSCPSRWSCCESPILERDPGIAAAMVWGLGRAADSEPEAAAALLDACRAPPPSSSPRISIELRAEIPSLGSAAAERCCAALSAAFHNTPGDEDVFALSLRLRQDLAVERSRGEAGEGATRSDQLLRATLERSVDAFVESGSREAYARARIALERASETMDMLDALQPLPGEPGGTPESTRIQERRRGAGAPARRAPAGVGRARRACSCSAAARARRAAAPRRRRARRAPRRWLLRSESGPSRRRRSASEPRQRRARGRPPAQAARAAPPHRRRDHRLRGRPGSAASACRTAGRRPAASSSPASRASAPRPCAAPSPPPSPDRSTRSSATAPPTRPTPCSTPPTAPPARKTSPSSPRPA